ncbi:hypothetical protein KJ765_00235 [Candidatus Micrarchaeota archaeon]|nr:hypothetical protein [Candidatus Micrarchaeota archaeon]
MLKLGKYELPNLSLEEAVDAAKTLEKGLIGKEGPKASFAKALGHSATSGAFYVKIADLRRYGLVTGRANGYQTTDLSRKLAYEADPLKYQEAVRELLFNISLYKDLFSYFPQGIEPDTVQFEIALQQITGVHQETIKKHCENIRKVYIDATRNSSMQKQYLGHQTPVSTQPLMSEVENVNANEEGFVKLFYGKKGKLELEESKENVDLLISFLENYKKKLEEPTST